MPARFDAKFCGGIGTHPSHRLHLNQVIPIPRNGWDIRPAICQQNVAMWMLPILVYNADVLACWCVFLDEFICQLGQGLEGADAAGGVILVIDGNDDMPQGHTTFWQVCCEALGIRIGMPCDRSDIQPIDQCNHPIRFTGHRINLGGLATNRLVAMGELAAWYSPSRLNHDNCLQFNSPPNFLRIFVAACSSQFFPQLVLRD